MAIDLTKRPLEEPEDHSSKTGSGFSLGKTAPTPAAPPPPPASPAATSHLADAKKALSQEAISPQEQTTDGGWGAPPAGSWQAAEDLSTWQYYLKAFQLFGNIRGRARRKEYWGFALWSGVMSLVMMAVDVALGFDGEFSPAYSLYAFAALIPGITVWVRRMHDVGRSGWWFLIYFTGIGVLFLIYWLFKDSEPGPNKWGPNPKGL